MANPNSRTRIGLGAGGGGTSFASELGPEQNKFGDLTTTNRAASEVLRDDYAVANVAWLTEYNDNPNFLILLQWDDGSAVLRRNVAGTSWEDVTNIVAGPAGPVGTVEDGNAALTQLRWSTSLSRWTAISPVNDIYYLLTRNSTFADASEAILYLLTQGVEQYPFITDLGTLNAYCITRNRPSFSTSIKQILNAWPLNDEAPYSWVLAPKHLNIIDRFTYKYYNPPGTLFVQDLFVVENDWGRINSVPYDAAVVQMVGDRPVNGSIGYEHTEPITSPTVQVGI